MSCSWSEERFEAYLDGSLRAPDRAALILHVRGCGACTGILEEMRVVDALLAVPREVELPANFTFRTMAEVRAMARPAASSVPAFAYLGGYLVAAWAVVATAFLFAPNASRAFLETAFDTSGSLLRILGTLVRAGARAVGDVGAPPALIGGAILVEVALVVALVAGVRAVRLRVQRQR